MHGINLVPEDHPGRTLTGHIDFIQVRNGAVHILDYKPDARTNKPIARLTLYALALTKLTGLRLFDIKCAWFYDVLQRRHAHDPHPKATRRPLGKGPRCLFRGPQEASQ